MTKYLIIIITAAIIAALLTGCSMELSLSEDEASYKGSIFVITSK